MVYKRVHKDLLNKDYILDNNIIHSMNNKEEIMANHMRKMPDNPFDLVELPSKGLFYPNRKDRLKVEYLIGEDEDIFSSQKLIESGEVFNYLLNKKVLDDDFNVKQLLPGDKDKILMFLRITGYGNIYKTKVKNPFDNKIIEVEVDLNQIKHKEIKHQPDENMDFTFVTPQTNIEVKFRLLNISETEYITGKIDGQLKNLQTDPSNRLILTQAITHFNGVSSESGNINIESEVKRLPLSDLKAFSKFYEEVSPGLDMNYEFQTPEGKAFFRSFTAGIDFFYPDLG
jgi:hypothetical protein